MLNRLLGKLHTSEDEEVPFKDLSEEEQAEILAEEKSARVKYHRDHVRNGPQSFRWITPGQQRRAAERRQKSQQRKANKRHRRQWHRDQFAKAVLRGHLQAVGALPYATDHVAPLQARLDSGTWLTREFGERYPGDVINEQTGTAIHHEGELVLSDDLLPDAVRAALEAYAR